MRLLLLVVAACLAVGSKADDADDFLNQYEPQLSDQMYADNVAQWTYNTNLTDYNGDQAANADADLAVFMQKGAENATAALTAHGGAHPNATINRLLKKISKVGVKLSQEDTVKLSNLVNKMTNVYSTGKVCAPWLNQQCPKPWELEPDLTDLFATNRNYEVLLYAWKSWRDKVGKPIAQDYADFVALSNKGATADGYADTGAWWRSWYESNTFESDLETLWHDLLPLYEELHTYVRNKLRKDIYPGKFDTSAIPAHVLGNMWAQEWEELFKDTVPFPNQPSVDVSQEMINQGYNASKMFHTADEFFQSLGLTKMPDSFYRDSMILKPQDRDVVCHASAWDFYNAKDYRIKMCTTVGMSDLITIHHEMGHIEYYLTYSGQPVTFREGSNPGFHEAIGDTMALSVGTPQHLSKIGLLKDYSPNDEQDINYLYKTALEKIAFLPYGYLIDMWRWMAFNGTIDKSNWNAKYWELRERYQGVVAPIERSNDDFDPGAKFHVPSNTPYIRYFVAFISEFQFYESMCKAAGQVNDTQPLYQCDFYQSKAAGDNIKKLLELGSSIPWTEALQLMTGKNKLDVSSITNYFSKLTDWLKLRNKGSCYGWGQQWPADVMAKLNGNRCPKAFNDYDNYANKWLDEYNLEAGEVYNKAVWAEWNYGKNVTNETQQESDAEQTKRSLFDQEQSKKVKLEIDTAKLSDPSAKRQVEKIAGGGLVLNADETRRRATLVSTMSGRFDTGKICKYENQNCDLTNRTQYWNQDPDLDTLFATSHDYEKLSYAWKGWRDVTGKLNRADYQEYVDLSNKGAKAAGYADCGEFWRSSYETPTFQDDLEVLWKQLLPLYEQLHTYVRRKLRETYPGKFSGYTIPAHLLGNVWAQEWDNLYEISAPYPDSVSVDVTAAMVEQNYTAMRMFRTAEAFYESIGLLPMTDEFWNDSMLVRPTDPNHEVDCYADSEDFYNGKDFGIKMCTKITMSDLITIHHEMGHIEYFMEYSHQPIKFRDGANAGFHEAIGDTMALSVTTPGHLHKIGLLDDLPSDDKVAINFLYKTALSKIAFLPFGYLIDQYRWKVFNGDIPKDKLNDGWWELRRKYQGLNAPVPRTNEDFDAGAKFHVDADVPYIRYFVSFVIQFQFHEALCKAAGHTGPLHECDIYQSAEAGNLLASMLYLGSSEKWPVAMMAIANTTKMSAQPLIDYFQPLINWLNKQNQEANDCYGWEYQWNLTTLPTPRCGAVATTTTTVVATTTTLPATTPKPDTTTTTPITTTTATAIPPTASDSTPMPDSTTVGNDTTAVQNGTSPATAPTPTTTGAKGLESTVLLLVATILMVLYRI